MPSASSDLSSGRIGRTRTSTPLSRRTITESDGTRGTRGHCVRSHTRRAAPAGRSTTFPRMGEQERTGVQGDARDIAAARRDVDAAIRDRMADEDMSDAERAARRHAASDRLDAMRDRHAAARDRDEARDERDEREAAQSEPPDDAAAPSPAAPDRP